VIRKHQLGAKNGTTARTAAALADLLSKTGNQPAAAAVRGEFELDSTSAPQTQPIRFEPVHE
jgi:hypothetical protein